MHTWLQGFRYLIPMLRKKVVLTLVIVASLNRRNRPQFGHF
jgi:hypothetical protein